jgi:hypothetical protein
MGTRLTTMLGIWRLLVAAVALGLLVALATSASAASPVACRVQNSDTGRTYQALQTAVDAAGSGDRLTVRGTCHGKTVIERSLVIEGQRSQRLGRPILDGDGKTEVLRIRRGSDARPRVRLTLHALTIRDGYNPSGSGGGISNNRGIVTLRDVVVRGSEAGFGGGVWNKWGTVRLLGRTRIVANEATYYGGGTFDSGSMMLRDSSANVGNTARWGGGASVLEGQLTLNDGASIRGNTATRSGGGVSSSQAGLTLNDSSTIRDNVARLAGGGVDDGTSRYDYYSGGVTLNDTSSITGNRALAPDSCCTPGCGGPRGRAGGVRIAAGATLTMTGASAITDNHAACAAGGLSSFGTLVGVSCAPATPGNVTGNTPDDCYIE